MHKHKEEPEEETSDLKIIDLGQKESTDVLTEFRNKMAKAKIEEDKMT